jgi:hypothetical protein
VDLLGRIQPDMGGDDAQENVLARADTLHADVLALEIGNATDAFFGKDFEAADVLAADDCNRFAGID